MGISAALGASALLPAGFGFRNIVVNGGMDIWQRGTSATIPTTVATSFQADRWSAYRAVSGSTQSRVASGLSGFQFALRIQRDSGNTSTSPIYVNQSFETSALSKVAGLPTVVSFYARAGANYSASGSSLLVRLGVGTGVEANVNYGSFTSYTEPLIQAVALTTTWQRFVMFVTVPAGTTQAGLYFTISPTGTASTADFVDITGVQFEQNTQPTSFEQRPFGIELAMCQRYYESSYELGTAIGTATENNCIETNYGSYTGFLHASGSYAVTKRVRPTIQTYATNNGNAGAIFVVGWGSTVYGATIGTNRIRAGVGTVTGTGVRFHYTADAEL